MSTFSLGFHKSWFYLYLLPLGTITQNPTIPMLMIHSCMSHIPLDNLSPLNELVGCIDDINCWMSQNFLQLNKEKTDILIVNPKVQRREIVSMLSFSLNEHIRNLGVIIDANLIFQHHITTVRKTAFDHLKKTFPNLGASSPSLTLTNWSMH